MESFILLLEWISCSFLHFLIILVLFALLIGLVREMKGIFVYINIGNCDKDNLDKEDTIDE